MIHKEIIFIVILLFLAACKGENEEVIDFNDLIPRSEEKHDAIDVEEETNLDSLHNELLKFKENDIDVISIQPITTSYFPDRFGAIRSEKVTLYKSVDTVNYMKWIYADSSKTMNAFFNWMDCFGKRCKSVFIGEERNLQKEAMLIFVNDSSLIFLESTNKLNVDLWEKYHANIGYAVDWNFQVVQSRWGKLKWFTYIGEQKTPYIK